MPALEELGALGLRTGGVLIQVDMAKRAVKKAKPKTKAKEAPKRGRGRPAKAIASASAKLRVEQFASVGCTQEEIAILTGISARALGRNYAETYKKGLANLKQSLRRKQVDLANGGNVTMLIWLGKNLLEQKDRSELTGKDGSALAPGTIVFTMPRNGRDDPRITAASDQTMARATARLIANKGQKPSEDVAEAPVAPPPMPVRASAPPPAPVPAPRYRGGGRDPRIVEDVRQLRPAGEDDGMPRARTGHR